MTVGFFTVFRVDPTPLLHAAALVKDVQRVMPDVPIVQLTDETTGSVAPIARRKPHGPMLERRLEHYADCQGDWLLVDTDVAIRADVRHVFDDPAFDVALTDRQWPHLPQTDEVLRTMPFNTGVVFSRSPGFWQSVLETWRGYPEAARDWLSEQRAVAAVVKSGQFHVKVLPGQIYNYPPRTADDRSAAAILHYKGPHRKAWRTAAAPAVLAR